MAAKRVLMGELDHGEAPQVSHDRKDVLIHRVDVKQVVLHLPDDAAERREVASEDAVLVHASQLVHDAARLLEDRKKHGAVARVAAETRVDVPMGAPERSEGRCRHALEVGALLHDQKAFQNCGGFALEQVIGARIEQLVDTLEALIDNLGLLVLAGKDSGSQVLQQNSIQLGDGLGSPVVALHEHLARATVRSGRKSEFAGDAVLIIEQQPVLAPSGGVVERDSNLLEQPLVPGKLARLGQRNKFALGADRQELP